MNLLLVAVLAYLLLMPPNAVVLPTEVQARRLLGVLLTASLLLEYRHTLCLVKALTLHCHWKTTVQVYGQWTECICMYWSMLLITKDISMWQGHRDVFAC